ncbi:hypothetical protein BGX27_009580 [Mortierella sp. AM989]|nr:hypothetical protein BGX27_009580 [Mortierella sp. AM989]
MPSINLYFVRHGQRIDQVDPSWADTSPCPQDPPLTAQGKTQARQTGKIIRDFARESRSLSTPVSFASVSKRITKEAGASAAKGDEPQKDWTTLQRITPPESPELGRFNSMNPQRTNIHRLSAGDSKRQHHFAIVTSPFLRCSQTAIEIAIGMKMATTETSNGDGSCNKNAQLRSNTSNVQVNGKDKDIVTISVESGLAGKLKWLSLEYVSESVPDSIIVQRMQDFAMARRDHEQYYSIDWKYFAKDRQLPTWPETRENMQERLERTLDHIITSYTAAAAKDKDTERDLSIVFVTHASPVNALLEACLQSPILVPVPNCSISRCQWTPLSTADKEDQLHLNEEDSNEPDLALLDALMQSKNTLTVAGVEGRWLLDYQTYTAHLDRDHR